MTILVRQADLESEREELLGVLQNNLGDLPHARRFAWLYRDNPARMAWSWFAYDTESKRTVGVASVFPRAMWLGGQIALCGQVGDFAIEASHRSLGPAIMLQRATFAPVDQGVLALCYDCPPHDRGMATFRRLGLDPNCQMQRYARLLRTERAIGKRIGSTRLAAWMAPAGDIVLRARRRLPPRAGLELAAHPGRFGEEFSELDRQVGGRGGIRGCRRAEDLNWRYRDDPLQDYRVFTAGRAGELVGFVIFMVSGQDAYIIDLFGLLSPEVGVHLLETVVEDLRTERAQTLQAVVATGNGVAEILSKAAFHYRSEGPRVVAYARPGSEAHAALSNSAWVFNHADVLA